MSEKKKETRTVKIPKAIAHKGNLRLDDVKKAVKNAVAKKSDPKKK